MKATPGNWVVVESAHLDAPKRRGLILETHGPAGEPPFLVRWDDTDAESIFVPGPGAHILTADEMQAQHRR